MIRCVFLLISSCIVYFTQESREARYSAVREILEDNIKLRDKTESRFQAFFDKELNRLKNDFRNESEVSVSQTARQLCDPPLPCLLQCCITYYLQVREREDDEIIEALNRYTLKLQTSLKVVNSTDM